MVGLGDAIDNPDDLTHDRRDDHDDHDDRDRFRGLLEAAALGFGGRMFGTSHRSEAFSPPLVLAENHRVQCGPIGCAEADHNREPLRGDQRAKY